MSSPQTRPTLSSSFEGSIRWRRAAFVDVNLEVGIAAAQHAGRARMVEVDVGEQQRPRLDRPEPVEQRVEARGGPGIDDQAVDLVGADHPVAAQVHDVDRTRQSDPTLQSQE